jgi:hypothetical protein
LCAGAWAEDLRVPMVQRAKQHTVNIFFICIYTS